MKSEKTGPLSRGIRNNNPLNIRVGNKWLGEVMVKTDKDFEQFTDVKYGIRAAILILWRYVNKHRLRTVYDIIKRWAPPEENSTWNYQTAVNQLISKKLGYRYWGDVSWDKGCIYLLLWAMCKIESYYELEWAMFEEAWDLAAQTNPRVNAGL